MEEELRHSRISIGLHTITGIIAAFLAVQLGGGLYALATAILILIITGFASEKLVGRKGIKWWITNGAILYLLVWLIAWIFLFNYIA
jgi:hypothetical protein